MVGCDCRYRTRRGECAVLVQLAFMRSVIEEAALLCTTNERDHCGLLVWSVVDQFMLSHTAQRVNVVIFPPGHWSRGGVLVQGVTLW